MFANTPSEAIKLLDDAFNRGDVDAIIDLYEENATVAAEPGQEARGTHAIRALYEQAATAGASAEQLVTKVFEAEGIALFLSRWTLTQAGSAPQTFVSTTVLRRQQDGGWKALIDNARGPQVLDATP